MWYHFGFVSWVSSRSTGLKFPIWTDNKLRPGNRASPVTGLICSFTTGQVSRCKLSVDLVQFVNLGLGGEGEEGFVLCNTCIICGITCFTGIPVLSAVVYNIPFPFSLTSFPSIFSFAALTLSSRVFGRDLRMTCFCSRFWRWRSPPSFESFGNSTEHTVFNCSFITTWWHV